MRWGWRFPTRMSARLPMTYRPVLKSVNDPQKFPTPKQLFEIDEFGGWSEVNEKFFDPDKGVMAEINKAKGVSTGG